MLQGLTYWEFRYPDDSQVPSIKEARDSLAIAAALYNAVFQRLPQSCHPQTIVTVQSFYLPLE